ncbi:hypothetical protein [Trichloromonas sp.]|uniref:hypothetical protein n=1 Tax=Trichloromonas sp. TaxID=3069249 RepID=UPI003D8144FB
MTRKKSDKTPASTKMQNNPFKDLKGFSVSASAKKPSEPESKPAVPASGEEAPASFAEEMTRLGVQRLAKPVPAREPAPPVAEKTAAIAAPVNDEELFAAALGKLDRVFVDQYPEDENPAASPPRRMKQLRQGKLAPEAKLDLHGICFGVS